jgi:hypothetical protein
MPYRIIVHQEAGLLTASKHFARHPGSQLTLRDWAGHNTTGSNDRLVSNVGHEDAPGTDPAISTD